MMAHSCFATEISENFTGLTNQVAGDGSGIFNVTGNSPVYGTLTFDSADFTPNPVAPAGSTYLDVFTGAPDSVMMTFRDAGGTVSIDAQSSFLEISSLSNVPWALVVSSGPLSFSLIVQPADPVTFSPGASLFDLTQFGASSLSVLLSDPSDSVGFDIGTVSVAPEPTSMLLLAAGLGILLLLRRWWMHASGSGNV
jgi:hypothetical protein